MSSTFLSKYDVICKIGEGSFSDVTKCQDHTSNKFYAAKRLKKIYLSMDDVATCPEISTVRNIGKHHNIVNLIEYHIDPLPGQLVLIYELMDGSMDDLIKTRKHGIPEHRAKNCLLQVLRGLEHLHANGIFHRDIKPENILYLKNRQSFTNQTKSETVKISDMGSCRSICGKLPYTEYISTRWYRSPECLLTTGYYGAKMDIWAVGCVFYELLTLKPLFAGENEVDQLLKIHDVVGTPRRRLLAKFWKNKSRNFQKFPHQQGSGLDPLLPSTTRLGRDILKQMLVYDPAARPNVRDVLEHRYFNDIRKHYEKPHSHIIESRKSSKIPILSTSANWKCPSDVGHISDRKRKLKLSTISLEEGESHSLPIKRPLKIVFKEESQPQDQNANTCSLQNIGSEKMEWNKFPPIAESIQQNNCQKEVMPCGWSNSARAVRSSPKQNQANRKCTFNNVSKLDIAPYGVNSNKPKPKPSWSNFPVVFKTSSQQNAKGKCTWNSITNTEAPSQKGRGNHYSNHFPSIGLSAQTDTLRGKITWRNSVKIGNNYNSADKNKHKDRNWRSIMGMGGHSNSVGMMSNSCSATSKSLQQVKKGTDIPGPLVDDKLSRKYQSDIHNRRFICNSQA